MNRHKVEVWGVSLRLFHWLLAVSLFTSWWAEGRNIRLHILAGCVIAGLLLYRLIWGFLGERYARFSSFRPSLLTMKNHLFDLIRFKSGNDVGHTPIGGLMIFMLLTILLLLVLSGFALMGLQMDIGLFSGWHTSFATEVLIQSIHDWCFEILLVLIAIHLAGVVVESLLQRSNLITGMFTGKKIIKEKTNL